MRRRIFIDSSVLFSAFFSSTGASRKIIHLAFADILKLVISSDVIEEVDRNLRSKAPKAHALFKQLMNIIPFETVQPSKSEIKEAALCVALKDAPILAAARKSSVDYLVSLDKRHLVGKPEVQECAEVKIISPEELLRILN